MKKLITLLALISSIGIGKVFATGAFVPYIQSTNSLQAGATFYVSSGTVAGTLSVGSLSVAGGAVPWIANQNSLQSGTTFYVSSGTVQGQLTVSTVSASAVLINGQGIFNGTYSPTITGCGTVGSNAGFYQQIGNMVHVWGSFQAGTATAETMSITIPVGSITYTNRLPTNGSVAIGTLFNMNGAQGAFSYCAFVLFADGSTTSAVFVTVNTPAAGTAAWPKANGNSLATNNAYQVYDFWYAVQ